jgi:queuine/archaeosine tRNA-ribosyltransferase
MIKFMERLRSSIEKGEFEGFRKEFKEKYG